MKVREHRNRENAYFCLSSRQKLKPPPNECPISPLPLSKVIQDSMAIIHVGFQTNTTLNRGWGGGLPFVFRGDQSRVQKLENRWSCLNSFVRGCSLRDQRGSAAVPLYIPPAMQASCGSIQFYAILYFQLALSMIMFA